MSIYDPCPKCGIAHKHPTCPTTLTSAANGSPASGCSLPSQFKGRFVGYGMGKIFVKTPKGETTALDVRGWGYLTGKGECALGMSEDDAIKVQDQFEAWVIEALNHYAENEKSDGTAGNGTKEHG